MSESTAEKPRKGFWFFFTATSACGSCFLAAMEGMFGHLFYAVFYTLAAIVWATAAEKAIRPHDVE